MIDVAATQTRPQEIVLGAKHAAGEKIDVVLVSLYFHPELAGSAPPITDLAWWFAENGDHVQAVTARPHYPLGAVYEDYRGGVRDQETVNDVSIRRFATYVAAGGGLVSRLLTETTFAAQLLRARITGSVSPAQNVVSVCPSIFNVAMASLFRRRGGRFLVIVHDIQSGLGASLAMGLGGILLGGLRMIERIALNRADVVVTLSEDMAESLRRIGVRAPISVLPPQIDIKEFDPSPARPTAHPDVLYSGNFGRKQGLEQVLHMAKELEQRQSSARIVLRGDGNQREHLLALKEQLALTNVAFEPLVPRNEIAASFASGAVHLIPQRPDGGDFAVPSKAFTIMAAARPFVCTAHDDSSLGKLAAETGSGLAVPPDDPVAFADAVESLLADPERCRRMGEAGRAHAAEYVDREVICAKMRTLLTGKAQTPQTR